MDLKETIKVLAETAGPSGNEDAAAELALGMLKEYCPEAEIKNGNVIGRFGQF